jgi:hypothetical protein
MKEKRTKTFAEMMSELRAEGKIALQGVKYDQNKIQMELLPLRELREVARVLTFGAKKYAPDNWKKVPNAKERYTGALLRHLTEYREGNAFDHETCPDPLRHIAQVACNALFLLYFELQESNKKDTPEIPAEIPVCTHCSVQPPEYCREDRPGPYADCPKRGPIDGYWKILKKKSLPKEMGIKEVTLF